MLALRGFRRLHHFHIAKCGGTSMNHWLNLQAADHRVTRPGALKGAFVEADGAGMIPPRRMWAAFHWFDVLTGHTVMRQYAPPDTFCFSVLRDPVQRVLSQLSDWRRLGPHDLLTAPEEISSSVSMVWTLTMSDFLDAHGHGVLAAVLDNHVTRAFAATRVGRLALETADAELLLEPALVALEQDFHFVGLTEEHDLSRNAICALLGLPPVTGMPALNVSRRDQRPTAEEEAAAPILAQLTRADRTLFARARRLFDARHRALAEGYDAAFFEAEHAATLLGNLDAERCGDAACFSVRQPLYGSGFHGRDGAGQANCAVWTGPDRRTTLYVPVPPGRDIALLVWIRGYAEARQRDQLRVRVDGRKALHRFEATEGYADLLVVPTCVSRSFVRLELELEETLQSGEPGTRGHDARLRGLSFDRYGWRPE